MILFVEMKSQVYGGQKALIERCKQLEISKVDYKVIHPYYKNNSFLEHLTQAGSLGRVLRPKKAFIEMSVFFKLIFVFFVFFRLAVKSKKILVHADSFDSAYTSVLAKLFFVKKIKIVFTVRSDRYFRFNFIDRFFIRFVDVLITNSIYSRSMLYKGMKGKLSEGEIMVNYSPIDFASLPLKRNYMPKNEFNFSYVGSFEKRKNLSKFVDYCAWLKEKNPSQVFVFNIFGEAKDKSGSSYLEEIKNKIALMGLEDFFVFYGYKNIDFMVKKTDALLCLYSKEPFGRVVAEFLYSGVPVFISNEGGLLEAGAGYALVIEGTNEEKSKENFYSTWKEVCAGGEVFNMDLEEMRYKLNERFSAEVITINDLGVYSRLGFL